MAKDKDENSSTPAQGELNFEKVVYVGDKDTGEIEGLTLDPDHDTVWASTEQMAKLFGRKSNTITEHLRNIFREGELDEATCARKFRVVIEDGRNYQVLHYNLDVILSVGYRVSSKQATQFRKWATDILKKYMLQGYAIDERRMENDPSSLKSLAAEVRALRTKEKNIYQAVRDCFKISSSDYSASSKHSRSFYAKLQDKFTFAITGATASEIVLERADGMKDFMGLTSTSSGRPTKKDATVGKNYLDPEELYSLHILCEQFLLFAESRAIRGQEITMQEMDDKFDQLLEVQGYPVFSTYGTYLKPASKKHAERELEVYRQRVRIEGKNMDGTPKAL